MNQPRPRIILALLAAAAVAAYVLRPVKPPERTGAWRPAERHPSHR